jgi:hypothetical protein
MDAEKRGAIALKHLKHITVEEGIPNIKGKDLREIRNKAKRLGLPLGEAIDLMKELMVEWASAHSGHSLPNPEHRSKLSDERKGEIALIALKENYQHFSKHKLGKLEKEIVDSGTSRADAAVFMESLVLEVYDENIAMLDRLQEAGESKDEDQ